MLLNLLALQGWRFLLKGPFLISTTLSLTLYILANSNYQNMSFWWVNQNQSFKAEFDGGYIWSPQTNKDGRKNPAYINLKKTAKGDIVFSYTSQKIPGRRKGNSSC